MIRGVLTAAFLLHGFALVAVAQQNTTTYVEIEGSNFSIAPRPSAKPGQTFQQLRWYGPSSALLRTARDKCPSFGPQKALEIGSLICDEGVYIECKALTQSPDEDPIAGYVADPKDPSKIAGYWITCDCWCSEPVAALDDE